VIQSTNDQIILLGIDPGFYVTGYAIARYTSQKTSIFDYGHLSLSSKKQLPERVKEFYDFFLEKVRRHNVSYLTLETPFLGKNVQSFLKLGYLRGILYLLTQQQAMHVSEFSPREIKRAVTGYGGASKEQVALVMMQLFPQLKTIGKTYKQDVTDALAICLTGIWQLQQHALSNH